MTDELLTLDGLAELYHCSRRHARDCIAKAPGFPPRAPGASPKNPLWVRSEVIAYIRRKPVRASESRTDPENKGALAGV